MRTTFNFGKIAEAVVFLRAFSEGSNLGSETENVQELLAFAEYALSERKPERGKRRKHEPKAAT